MPAWVRADESVNKGIRMRTVKPFVNRALQETPESGRRSGFVESRIRRVRTRTPAYPGKRDPGILVLFSLAYESNLDGPRHQIRGLSWQIQRKFRFLD